MDDGAETRPVADCRQPGHREPFGLAQRHHEAEAGECQQKGEEAGEPSAAEAPRLDRRFKVTPEVSEIIPRCYSFPPAAVAVIVT